MNADSSNSKHSKKHQVANDNNHRSSSTQKPRNGKQRQKKKNHQQPLNKTKNGNNNAKAKSEKAPSPVPTNGASHRERKDLVVVDGMIVQKNHGVGQTQPTKSNNTNTKKKQQHPTAKKQPAQANKKSSMHGKPTKTMETPKPSSDREAVRTTTKKCRFKDHCKNPKCKFRHPPFEDDDTKAESKKKEKRPIMVNLVGNETTRRVWGGQYFWGLPKRYPNESARGNEYLLVMVDYVAGYVHAATIKSRKTEDLLNGYKECQELYSSRGLQAELMKTDDEVSQTMVAYIQENALETEYPISTRIVPPEDHRRNEATARTFDFLDYFVTILENTHPTYPAKDWDLFLLLANISFNFLRPSPIDDDLSVYVQMHGRFDLDSTPLAPGGSRVMIYNHPSEKGSSERKGIPGWSIGPAMNHYRCIEVMTHDGSRRFANIRNVDFCDHPGIVELMFPETYEQICEHPGIVELLFPETYEPDGIGVDDPSKTTSAAPTSKDNNNNNNNSDTKAESPPNHTITKQHHSSSGNAAPASPLVFDVVFREDKLGLRLKNNGSEDAAIITVRDVKNPKLHETIFAGDSVVSINGRPLPKDVSVRDVSKTIQACTRPMTIRFSRPHHPKDTTRKDNTEKDVREKERLAAATAAREEEAAKKEREQREEKARQEQIAAEEKAKAQRQQEEKARKEAARKKKEEELRLVELAKEKQEEEKAAERLKQEVAEKAKKFAEEQARLALEEEEKKKLRAKQLQQQRENARLKKERGKEKQALKAKKIVEERLQYWEIDRKDRTEYLHVVREFCKADGQRKTKDLDPSLYDPESAVKSIESYYFRLPRTYNEIFPERSTSSVKIVEHKNKVINGRCGRMIAWDESKKKYKIGLESKNNKAEEQVFVAPEHLEVSSVSNGSKNHHIGNNQSSSPSSLLRTSLFDIHFDRSIILTLIYLYRDDEAKMHKKIESIMAERAVVDKAERIRMMREETLRRQAVEKERQENERRAKEAQKEREQEQRDWDRSRNFRERMKEARKKEQKEAKKWARRFPQGKWEFDIDPVTHERKAKFHHPLFPPRNDDFDDFQFFDDGYERFDYESSDDEDEDVNEGEVGIEEHAAVLGVSVNATDEEVRSAFKKKALRLHPDKYKGEENHDGLTKQEVEEEFKRCNAANEFFKNRMETFENQMEMWD